jgi:putative transposase
MNIRKHRKLAGEIKTCSLLIKNQKYYACFSCEIETKPKLDTKLISLDKQIGIDVNTSGDNFWVLDTGEKQKNAYFYQTVERELGELSEKLSHKKHKRNKDDKTVVSKRYNKEKLYFAKQAERVSNQRKDFVFKEVKQLTNNYDFFGVENFKSSKIVEKAKERSK